MHSLFGITPCHNLTTRDISDCLVANAVAPGSSIMPGKVNPVIPETVNQIAFQVVGQDMTVTMASEAGQLQLNVFEPVMAYSLLTSLRLLTRGYKMLREKCVIGM